MAPPIVGRDSQMRHPAGCIRQDDRAAGQAPADDGLVPWFYRTLKNAAIDRFRRREAAGRSLGAFATELQTHAAPEPEIAAEICACIGRLASTLKPQYAEALQAIDVQGTPVKAFAAQRDLSVSNAGVRIFRARAALKRRLIESCGTCAEHGCRDCTCQQTTCVDFIFVPVSD